jgi:hypothetical protein
MTDQLPQKYQDVAKALIPYTPNTSFGQMVLIFVDPALPCFLCGQPAEAALVTPAPDSTPGAGTPWLTFPICPDCEKRQVTRQSPGQK